MVGVSESDGCESGTSDPVASGSRRSGVKVGNISNYIFKSLQLNTHIFLNNGV